MLAHERAWERLPPDVREIVTREFDRSGADQRADLAKLSQSLRQDLTAEGLRFIDIDRESFRQALAKTSFYADWKERFGAEAWTALEKTTGRLA
jgi:TRAP-type C4-dicarboxylate transport system substrate-binding protein